MRFLISHGGTMLVTSATKHCSPMEINISALVLSVLEQQEGLGTILLLRIPIKIWPILLCSLSCIYITIKNYIPSLDYCFVYHNAICLTYLHISCRYRLSIIATDPNPPAEQQSERTIQLVFFGSTAQEIIGTPVDTLIATNQGVGMFLPRKITALYEKQYDLRVSVSSMSLQQVNITYQVDAIVGIGPISTPTLPLLHSRMSHNLNLFHQIKLVEYANMLYQLLYLPDYSYSAIPGQCPQQSGTESQGVHSTEKYIAITTASGSGSTPPEYNKVSIWHKHHLVLLEN